MSERLVTHTLDESSEAHASRQRFIRAVQLQRLLVIASRLTLLSLVSVTVVRGLTALWRDIGDPLLQIRVSLPLVALICVIGMLMLVLVDVAEKKWHVPSEYARKFAHVGAGAISFTLPVFFSTHWPVLTVAIIFSGTLLLSRRFGWLASLHPTAQRGNSDILFLWAVYLVFLLTKGNGLLFQIPVLVLTVGDTAAALIGQRYGCIRYQISESIRTLEGSIAFVASTILCVLFFLLGFTEMSLAQSAVLSLMVAIIASTVEAITPKGLDNLTIPVVTLLLLEAVCH